MFWDICGAVSFLILFYLDMPLTEERRRTRLFMALCSLVVEPAEHPCRCGEAGGGPSNAGLAQSFIKDDSYGCG